MIFPAVAVGLVLSFTPINNGCKSATTAVVLCDEAFFLKDAFDRCRINEDALKAKLEVRTSSVIIRVVEVEKETTPWWSWIALGVGIVGSVVAGVAIAVH